MAATEAVTLRRVLIANRGEIAIRVARAAADAGVETVGVHTASDVDALHTRHTTTARRIGPADDGGAVGAYLDAAELVRAAVDAGCDGVHPGYGFLAESAELARRCDEAGITFVGPRPETLELFGDKVRARGLARSLAIPVIEGSDGPLAGADEAREVAGALGYPVMLKAVAGGGGRGIRRVDRPEEMDEAFERCRSEAAAAFGDGSVYLERLVDRPRHIEVQVLADIHGGVVHLHDRDCSVQLRHQKVIEVAPAPALDDDLRARVLADAVELVRAAGYHNAGTVELLVDPDRGEHFFIECNARIQVEHTVTEQVTGVDLVTAQLAVASGAPLAALGLADQDAVGRPSGFAVQARVVARGGGTITGYREPSGPGVRVDGCGYPGLTPPPQFDPLLAKVIGSAPTLDGALRRTARALDELHVAGILTNVAELRALLAHPDVRAGDARTTLLSDAGAVPTSTDGEPGPGAIGELLDRLSPTAPNGHGSAPAGAAARPALDVPDGSLGIVSPLAGTVVEVPVPAGAAVAEGATVLVVTALKMETQITAPAAGVVTALAELGPGDVVEAGQVVAVIDPTASAGPSPVDGSTAATVAADETWQETVDQVQTLRDLAAARLAPGSEDPGVVRQRSRGKLTCRERIDLLLDDGSFREVGSVAGFASHDADGAVEAFTPANHVGGRGRIEGRRVVVCADDFTSRGGHADGAIGAKSLYLDRLSTELAVPSIRLLDGSSGGGSVAAMVPEQKRRGESSAQESSGAITAGRPRVAGTGGSFLPGHLGSTDYAHQLATVPVVNVLLGSVVGIGAAKAVLGHFSVMVRDIAQLFVAGPPVVRHAMGYDITKEDLGGWHIHGCNGSVDNVVDTEEDAMAEVRRFLSYLPSSVHEAPPLTSAVGPAAEQRTDELFTLVPRKRTTTFDMRRAIELMADDGSFFEIGRLWGTDQIVGFVRVDGRPLGVLASDSRQPNGGALTADGCDKLTRHLDLCDLFHLPILNLVDNPGFAVGLEHEQAATIRRGGEWMIAFAQTRVPIFTVIVRRSFGVAGNNYATPRATPSVRVAWPSADVGGIPPEGGIEAAYKRQLAEATDPDALRAELNARIESARGPLGPLSKFQIEEMIDPRDTRAMVSEWAETAHRIVSQPAELTSRPLRFRP
ncbi:MAG: carboxyl transferase domain-containing protein [Actinomycetota bacterium]|nr:carboxyl transferase domain-containing protein [Actinomycetota bacterium]